MKRNFTLTELAVVVSLSVLVLTVLVSSAHAAVEQAKKATCQDVLRKIGGAVQLYAKDNANFVPCSVRKDNPEMVEVFGHNLNEMGNKLLFKGYFGVKPKGRYDKIINTEKMKYFVCPDDQAVYKRSGCGSYIYFVINQVAAVARKRFGEEQYARILITRDRPENSLVFDAFPYRGGVFKTSAHGDMANILRLGGEVNSYNIKPAATASSIWNWIGEYMDGIEL